MLNREITDLIREIVSDRIALQESFSAYDVTKELREQHIRGYHSQFKEVVHEMFEQGEMGDYTRELKDFGGPVMAWEYRPRQQQATAPNHLQPSPLRSYGPAQTVATPVAPGVAVLGVTGPSGSGPVPTSICGTTVPAVPSTDDSEREVKVDGRGTVCIPSALVRSAGLEPGDTAYVYCIPDQLIVSPEPWDEDADHKYTVDKHANIRITRAAQQAAGLQGVRLKIVVDDDEILVAQP
jgi:bifunctional DNA-binding transcriptional regulator/antitoxin component of YhaV-PrlF toxin-antitoxin module